MITDQHSTIIPQLQNTDVFKVLDYWVKSQPDARLYTFLKSDGSTKEQLNYKQFSDSVNRMAAHFQQNIKAERGDRILLCYQPGLEFICALFACNKAGFIGVPTLPLATHNLSTWQFSVEHILKDSEAVNIALCSETQNTLDVCFASSGDESVKSFARRLSLFNTIITTRLEKVDLTPQENSPCNTFFIQYTSGSTSDPKGVEVTHSNLLANANAVVDHKAPIAVSWLPQHHDMGLIGYYIDIVLSGGTTFGFSPNTFIKRPALWFETITKYRVTASSAPNFALEMCLHERRVPEQLLEQFDLSSLRFLMIAAEPVKADCYRAFVTKFSRCGLRPESLFVAYGLAEFTLAASNYGRRSLSLDSQALSQGLVRTVDPDGKQHSIEIMSCGTALADTEIKIVNPESHLQVDQDTTGEIWLGGNSRAKGYWNNSDITESVFNARIYNTTEQADGYLRTGDSGFLHHGELFVCGRIKDTLIIRGRNIYPQDVEKIVQNATPKIRNGGVVAFNSTDSDAITVVAELVRVTDIPASREIVCAIRDALQISTARLVFLAPRSIAKTSSGKVRRTKTRERFEQGLLTVIDNGDGYLTQHSTNENSIDIDVLKSLQQRYHLSGDEEFTLFDAGLDSLDLITLLHWLKEALSELGNPKLSKRINTRLFGIVTVKQIFTLGRLLKDKPEQAGDWLVSVLNNALETRLANEKLHMQEDRVYKPKQAITEPLSMGAASNKKTGILLTGGTGFLGPFLLLSLLEQTEASIYVLVRGDNQTLAEARLRQVFQKIIGPSAPLSSFDARVTVLCGDLEAHHFALPSTIWQSLVHSIDTIYHNGALVNYLLDYQRMRQANVVGTERVIDFALAGKPKVLNHISTTFIFGWATKDVLHETDRNKDMARLDFGYSQSKWVSEQLVFSAMQQGLDARIFRPALITPTVDGRGGNLDITIRLLAFMIKNAMCVNTQNQVSFMPADITANNIVAIAEQAQTLNTTFHVTRDQLETLPQITDLISDKTGIRFNAHSLKNFVPEVIDRCTKDDPLYPLLDFLVESVDNISAMEYKLYNNDNYRGVRDKSHAGLKDAPLESIVDGIIRFLGVKKLLPHEFSN
jgi:thioester reductase-like protein